MGTRAEQDPEFSVDSRTNFFRYRYSMTRSNFGNEILFQPLASSSFLETHRIVIALLT